MINEYDIEDMRGDSIVFECTHSNPKLITRMEMSAHSHITEVVEQFERFLRGMGYFPPANCHLDFVDDNTYVIDWEEANE
jgi:hypothetical protein